MQIAVCDDQAEELEWITGLLREYAGRYPETDLEVQSFRSGYDLLEYVRTRGGFELYLLDVMMPEQDGIAVGASIREKDSEAMIVYLTSSPDYAVASYRVRALDYLLKPVGREALFSLMNRAAEKTRRSAPSLTIKTREGLIVTPMWEVCFVEGAGHRARFHLADGREIATGTIRSFEEAVASLLAEPRFLRVGASYVVNMLFVESLTKDLITMGGGGVIPIPRLRRPEVRQTFLDFMLERGRNV